MSDHHVMAHCPNFAFEYQCRSKQLWVCWGTGCSHTDGKLVHISIKTSRLVPAIISQWAPLPLFQPQTSSK